MATKVDTKVKQIVEIAEKHALYFFEEEDTKEVYAFARIPDHFESIKIKSKAGKLWLIKIYYDATGNTVSDDTISSVQDLIIAKTLFDPAHKVCKLHLRTAWYKDRLYYDLGDRDWKAVQVYKNDVRIVSLPFPLFKRYGTMKEQKVNLHANGDALSQLCEILGLKSSKPNYALLYKVYLVSCFIAEIIHVMFVIVGEHGGGKSTLAYVTKMIVDPSIVTTTSLHKDFVQVMQLLQHNYMVVFDNVTDLKQQQSDQLCRAVTGDSIIKRMLYTDEDDVVFRYMRCIVLNGINLPSTKGDFVDRALIFLMNRISKDSRKTRDQILKEFEAIRPDVLGHIFRTLSDAMAKIDQVKAELEKKLPRMAEFAEYGEAIARALGYKPLEFLRSYEELITNYNYDVIEQYTIGQVIMDLVEQESSKSLEMSATEWLKRVTEYANSHGVNTKARDFPKRAAEFSKQLRSIKPNLENIGYELEFYMSHDKQTKNQHFIKVSKKNSGVVAGSGSSGSSGENYL